MREACSAFGFTPHTRPELLQGGILFFKDLQGHVDVAQHLVAGQVDFPHPSAPQGPCHKVPAVDKRCLHIRSYTPPESTTVRMATLIDGRYLVTGSLGRGGM